MRYRKNPTIIDAVQYKYAINSKECEAFCPNIFYTETGSMMVATFEGDLLVSPDDFIIKKATGKFYLCKPDIFKLTYSKI